jgi:hypothetical protein
MVNYTVVPRGRGYWVEVIADDGSRYPVERYNTEDEAVQRLHVLQEKAGITRQSKGFLPPGRSR